jgi:putative flippase GtrA
MRFFLVSLVALAANILILHLLVVYAGLDKLPAQAVAIVLVTPLNFVGNKLWSFRLRKH